MAFCGGAALILFSMSLFGFSFGRTKPIALPGGGTVTVPAAYEPMLPGDYRHKPSLDVLIAYRNHHSTMADRDCDGMIAVGHERTHADLATFVGQARGGLTTSWSYANLEPGWFGGEYKTYPIEKREGPEWEQYQRVHLVGFWDVYDKPGKMLAMKHANGIMTAVWIFDSHGGVSKARKISRDIAASYVP